MRARVSQSAAQVFGAIRSCVGLLVACLVVASSSVVAGDVDVVYRGHVKPMSEGVMLRYGKSTGIPYRIEAKGVIFAGSERQVMEMVAEATLSTRVSGDNVAWDVKLARLVNQGQVLEGELPIVEIHRETDRMGLGKSMKVGFPLLEARSGSPVDPSAPVYRRLSDMLVKQTGVWQPLPSRQVRSGEVLVEVEADSLLGEPSAGMHVEGTILGTVKGLTQHLDREAVLVETAGSLILKFSGLALPGEMQGYRLLDSKTALPLEAKAAVHFSGDVDGRKISMDITRTLTIVDQ